MFTKGMKIEQPSVGNKPTLAGKTTMREEKAFYEAQLKAKNELLEIAKHYHPSPFESKIDYETWKAKQ